MFSVIVATRDRPELLGRALRSVSAQRSAAFELVLVDDSSAPDARNRNAAILAELIPGATVVVVPVSAAGSGPGDARNRGIEAAAQPYLAFLDDDDEWLDPDYLGRAAAAVAAFQLDLLFADQVAIRPDGSAVTPPVWSEDLADKLPAAGLASTDGVFRPTAAQILLSDGFAHLNTTVIRRAFVADRLGGFDPAIRYEEDRDLFLRAIDATEAIGYMPGVVARHYVPAVRTSASNIAAEQKDACRLAVLGKAAAHARNAAVRARARRDRSFVLQQMCARAAQAGHFAAAIRHGRAALRDRFSPRGALFVASLYLRKAVSSRSQAG